MSLKLKESEARVAFPLTACFSQTRSIEVKFLSDFIKYTKFIVQRGDSGNGAAASVTEKTPEIKLWVLNTSPRQKSRSDRLNVNLPETREATEVCTCSLCICQKCWNHISSSCHPQSAAIEGLFTRLTVNVYIGCFAPVFRSYCTIKTTEKHQLL